MIRPIRLFWVLAAVMAWFGKDGTAQPSQLTAAIHMTAGASGFTDMYGVVWAPNSCTNSKSTINTGAYPNPIYNTPAVAVILNAPITCTFNVPNGVYSLIIHTIEAVRSFNAPQKRVFNILANGQPLITGVDVYQRAGGVSIPYDVVSLVGTQSGQLTISFTQVKSSAMFAGIELVQIVPSYSIVDYETPSGVVDGVNTAFLLAQTPYPLSSLHIFVNGLLQAPTAFVQSGQTFTFAVAPPIGATIIATYWYGVDVPVVTAAQRWQCQGSGVAVDGTQWDCAGLWKVQLILGDGTVRGPYVGIVAGSKIATNANWVPIAADAP